MKTTNQIKRCCFTTGDSWWQLENTCHCQCPGCADDSCFSLKSCLRLLCERHYVSVGCHLVRHSSCSCRLWLFTITHKQVAFHHTTALTMAFWIRYIILNSSVEVALSSFVKSIFAKLRSLFGRAKLSLCELARLNVKLQSEVMDATTVFSNVLCSPKDSPSGSEHVNIKRGL